MNDDTRGLVPLDQLDGFEVADGYTDIRGFDAYLPDGSRAGEVGELLVDPAARRVAAVTVDVDGRGQLARVPIEHVEIDTPSRRVLVASEGIGYLGAGRTGAGGAGDVAERGYGAAAGDLAAGGYDATARGVGSGATEERMTLAREELDVRTERMAAGSVDVQKRVETEHVRQSIPVMREEVSVDRRPVTEAGAPTEPYHVGDELHVPLVQEELVVEKRLVAREEIVIRRHQVQEEQVVEADLRRERAEVHNPQADAMGARDDDRGNDTLLQGGLDGVRVR